MDERECLEHLAAEIRRRARRRRLSIERLADFAGVSRPGLWSILACKHYPTLRWIVRVANALDCRPRDLVP